MNRRKFIAQSSAGLSFVMMGPGLWSCTQKQDAKAKKFDFKPYRSGKTLGKVYQVTPDDGFYIHTYYDVCPFSPSGKYLAVSKLSIQDRHPVLGETADVWIINLEEQTIRKVYTTKCWGIQVGTNAEWGTNDKFIYSNDIIDGHAVCVRIDLDSGEVVAYNGPKYDIAPDASCVIGPKLELMDFTQLGYGAPSNPDKNPGLPVGASKNEGIWKTDLQTRQTKLFLSLYEASQHLNHREFYDGGTFYFWHCKFNRQNTRIMQVIRCIFSNSDEAVQDAANPEKNGWNHSVLTLKTDGMDIQEAVTREQWSHGGHHPNWHPDGEHVIMNLKPVWLGDDTLRFCQMKYDGSDFKILSTKHMGSGHPSVDKSGRYLLSDAYPSEPVATDDGEVPIRLLDLEQDHEETICTIFTDVGKPRCDAHPAWGRNYKKVCFNGAPNGNRKVFIADLMGVV